MKKFKHLLFLIAFVAIFFTISSHQAFASEDDWEKTFFDDFSAYSIGKAEDSQDFKDVWTNDLWSGTNPTAQDINDVATIKQEGANKYLNLNYDGSFFYISPHNFRAKEFEVSFKMRSHDLTSAWVGVVVRKAYRDARFNGTTNMMLYFRTIYIEDESNNVVGEMIQVQAQRGGSLSTTDLTSEIVDASGNTGSEAVLSVTYMYPEQGDIDTAQQIKDNWYDIKVVVSDTGERNEASYEMYINDSLIGTLTHARSSLDTYGFISLTACTSDIDVDDFSITSNDTVSPPPIVRVNKLVGQTGTVNETISLPGSEDGDIELIGDADNKVEIVIGKPDGTDETLAEGVYEFTPTEEGIYTVTYLAKNASNGEGTVEFMISVQGDESTTTTTTEDTNDITTTENDTTPSADDSDDSNGSTIIIVVIAAIVLVGGATSYFILRKK